MSALQWIVTSACVFVLAMAALYAVGVYFALKDPLDWENPE